MPDSKIRNVIVYGLGAMGRPMARNLNKEQLLHGVWNRTTGKTKALNKELDLPEYESLEALCAEADAVLTCVSADQDLIDVIESIYEHLKPGSTVIDCSTVSPKTARTLADTLASRSIGFIDAPVSGGVEGAQKGTLSIMVGAEKENYKRASEVFSAIGSQITYMGKVGQGQATKVVNQVMVAGIAQAVCSALAMAEKCNLDLKKAVEVFSAGAAGNWFLDNRGTTMLNDEFSVGFKLSLLHKDLYICQETASELNGHLEIIDNSIKDYGQLLKEGHGDDDISGLIKLKRENFE
ncbi:NAD(P)-dependent oxidoreductase [Marinicella sp. W31]|uniref:NAD(P)-dependent oxidoreductase n=1 Tax=Marinicella sp. W31 TaxID=3023713 RepID=UPI0037577602